MRAATALRKSGGDAVIAQLVLRDTAIRLAGLLPDGRYSVLEGQDHGAPADVVAPVVAAFLAEAP